MIKVCKCKIASGKHTYVQTDQVQYRHMQVYIEAEDDGKDIRITVYVVVAIAIL